jgi:hypothetical protein
MKRLALLVVLVIVALLAEIPPKGVHAQQNAVNSPAGQVVNFTSTSCSPGCSASTTGPIIDATQGNTAGVYLHTIVVAVVGTVSAGAIKLQQSGTRDFSSPSDCIGAQTVTSSAGAITLTTCNAPYFRLFESTPITGSGTVTISYLGFKASTIQASIISPAPVSAGASTIPGTGTALPTAALLFNWNGANWVPVNTTDIVAVLSSATATGSGVTTYMATGSAVTQISNAAGQIYGLAVDSGANTGDVYVSLFNSLSANVTLGSTPVLMSFKVPGGTAPTGGGNTPIPFGTPIGIPFSTALSWACTTVPGGATQAGTWCGINLIRKN